MAQRIITAVGPDRPGLVGEFTGHLHQAGVNIADSRMVNLRGQFALLLLVEGEPDKLEALSSSAIKAGEASGLVVTVAPLVTTAPASASRGIPYRLKTYSMDQPGIVHGITSILQKHGVNIEELSTKQESAAFAGTTLFTMEALLAIPSHVAVKQLREALGAKCDQLNIDMDLEPA
ncbi:MAG: hypothetical protein HC898_01310 [Phycisphaerales bacterium]|nr:hypothetical protein [Phycisphaerales bacterium]